MPLRSQRWMLRTPTWCQLKKAYNVRAVSFSFIQGSYWGLQPGRRPLREL